MKFLADEDFKRSIVRGLLRKAPELDIITSPAAGLVRASDPVVLEWAAASNRVVLTHDVRTLVHHAYERVRRGLAMPGVVAVTQRTPVGRAIDDILIIAACCSDEELVGVVQFVPL